MTRPRTPVPLYPYKARLPAPIYWIYRAIRTVLVAICFAGFWSGSVLLAWLGLPFLVLWPGSRPEKMRRVLRAVQRGFRLFHFWMRTMRLYHRTSPFKAVRPNGAPADSPVVLVANHPTLCDVTSIISLFPNVVAVARPSLANNPLLRYLVRACGFVPVGIHMLQECEERLRMGFDVLIFPEGTRSPQGGSLHPFHRGAFELAARAKVPLVLLKLTCAPSALSKRLPIWKVADRMAVLTIEPIETIQPAGHELGSRALCQAIEQRYRDELGYPAPAEVASEPQSSEVSSDHIQSAS
jgi:1-acyl-sn-glycerol-3-phosphate acyltransferase